MPGPVLWQRLAACYAGTVRLWIDQGKVFQTDPPIDTYDLEMLKRILFEQLEVQRPSPSVGTCVAVAYDWIRNNMVLAGDFEETFRGADDLHYESLQLRHKIRVADHNMTLRERSLYRKIRRTYESFLKSAPEDEAIVRKVRELERTVDELTLRMETIRREMFELTFSNDHLVHIKELSDKEMFAGPEQIVAALEGKAGWLLLAVEGGIAEAGGGGHAFGLRLGPSTYQLLDANTGIFEFPSAAALRRFFGELLWEQIYSAMYFGGRFTLVQYSLYPFRSLDEAIAEKDLREYYA